MKIMQKKIFNNKIPKNLFIISIFIIFFFIGSQIYIDYGFYIDEKFHRANGFYWLNYLANFFDLENLSQKSNIKFQAIQGFTLPKIEHWNFYGVIFDVPAAYLEIIFNLNDPKKYYQMRHFLVFFIFFICSIFFYKILFNRYKNYLVSSFGLILFILTPRIFGDSFWNNKDIVFLSLYAISIFYFFKVIDRQSLLNIFLLSLFAALSTSIRFAGIFLPLSLIFLFFIDKISKRSDVQYKTLFFHLIFYFLILFLTWPALWNNFFLGLISSFNLDMSWSGKVNFLGKYYLSDKLPYHYFVFWIIISTPIVHMIFFILGFYNYIKRLFSRYFKIEKKSIYNDLWRSSNEKKDFLISVNLIFFLTILSFMNIDLYNSWRLGYFLYIFIIYFSTYGIYLLIIKFKGKLNYVFAISFVIIFFLIYRINLYHPYQSLYFNLIVPSSIKKNVDVDYTGLSGYHFLKDLSKTENNTNPIKVAVNSWYPLWRMIELLDEEEKSKIQVFGNDKKDKVDYLYSNRIYDVDKRYYKKYDIPDNFKIYKEYKIDNTIIYEVYKRLDK